MSVTHYNNSIQMDTLSAETIYDNERGAALIVVLMMLLLLTILGGTLLSTSTTDLQIAGNYRNNQKAFYINDYEFEYLKSPAIEETVYQNIDLLNPGSSKTFTDTMPVTGETINYTVSNIGCLSGAPPGSGNDADTSNAYNVYSIDIDAVGSNNATVSTTAGNIYQRGKPCDLN